MVHGLFTFQNGTYAHIPAIFVEFRSLSDTTNKQPPAGSRHMTHHSGSRTMCHCRFPPRARVSYRPFSGGTLSSFQSAAFLKGWLHCCFSFTMKPAKSLWNSQWSHGFLGDPTRRPWPFRPGALWPGSGNQVGGRTLILQPINNPSCSSNSHGSYDCVSQVGTEHVSEHDFSGMQVHEHSSDVLFGRAYEGICL